VRLVALRSRRDYRRAMRVGIVGAGGVGGLIAGLLARAGDEVAVVAREKTRDALRERGIRVDSPLGVFAARVEVGSPQELAPVDAVLIAVKTWQVTAVAQALGPMLRPDTLVATLQNGVDAPDQCAAVLGPKRVYGGVAHVLSWIVEPGSVKHVAAPPRFTLGPWRSPVDDRLRALTRALESAGAQARIADDLPAALWDKFLFIASWSGVGAVARSGAGALRRVPQTRQLLVGAFEEVRALAIAKGIALRPDAVDRALALVDLLPEDSTSSLQRDIVAGRPSEIDALSGAAARIGSETGVPVPIHATIFAALLPQEQAARAADRG
jgi:2-dehydropantoate 2-reductase